MNVIRKLFLSVFALTGFTVAATSANAQYVMQQCNSCTEQQYESLAKSLGLGNHLIADFPNNVLHGYHITREPSGKGGGYIYEVDPLTTTELQQDAFNAYHTLIVTNHSSAISVTVPTPRPAGFPVATDAGSAIDWATQTSYQALISNWLGDLQERLIDDNWLSGTASAALFVMQSGIIVNNYKSALEVRILTKNGSKIALKWDDGTLVLLSVVDQYGNMIPIRDYNHDTNFNGSYNIPVSNATYAQALINYLNALGAKIVVNPSQFPIAIVCVKSTCEQQY